MSESKVIDIGMFEITKAVLSNSDKSKQNEIGMLITDIMVNESIYSSYVGVDIMIYDTHALSDEFPIVGEETIELTILDYYAKPMTYNLHVYAINEIAPDDKSDSQSYLLHCMTSDFMVSETTRIQQSMSGTVSEMVKTVHDQYLKSKEIDIEATDSHRQFVIPSFTPVETINFLARKAFSATNKSCNFMFFENREKYVFKTHEQIFKDAGELPKRNTFYYGETKLDVNERSELMNHAIMMKPKRRFNLIDTVRKGAMISEVVRIDPGTRSFTSTIYDHGDEFANYQHSDAKSKEYHTADFRSKYLSKENNVVNTFLTFEESNEGERAYAEIIPRRNSTAFYLRSNAMEMEINGCNDIFAGSVLNLIIPEMKFKNGDKDNHPNISGRYLVETINHTMSEKKWSMRLTMIKDSFVNG